MGAGTGRDMPFIRHAVVCMGPGGYDVAFTGQPCISINCPKAAAEQFAAAAGRASSSPGRTGSTAPYQAGIPASPPHRCGPVVWDDGYTGG
jgi:hypothetical protein